MYYQVLGIKYSGSRIVVTSYLVDERRFEGYTHIHIRVPSQSALLRNMILAVGSTTLSFPNCKHFGGAELSSTLISYDRTMYASMLLSTVAAKNLPGLQYCQDMGF